MNQAVNSTGRLALSGTFAASANPRPVKRGKRPAPFSLRLSAAERARLEQDAGETPLATYIKFRLFNGLPELSSYKLRRPGGRKATDTQLIAKLLAALGESRLSQNLNQLAKHANMGTLEVAEDTEKELLEACSEVHAMRRDLLAALGLKVDGSA